MLDLTSELENFLTAYREVRRLEYRQGKSDEAEEIIRLEKEIEAAKMICDQWYFYLRPKQQTPQETPKQEGGTDAQK